jgi:hypothetical protein
MAWNDKERHGKERHGKARQAWQGNAKEWKGMTWHGFITFIIIFNPLGLDVLNFFFGRIDIWMWSS